MLTTGSTFQLSGAWLLATTKPKVLSTSAAHAETDSDRLFGIARLGAVAVVVEIVRVICWVEELVSSIVARTQFQQLPQERARQVIQSAGSQVMLSA